MTKATRTALIRWSKNENAEIISGRTSAAPVHQQYQQLLQQYQHPAAPTAFLQQQQQQQQAQAAAAAAAAVEHQMDNEVKTYVSVKADPIEPTRIKYTCNACQFSPKNIGYACCSHQFYGPCLDLQFRPNKLQEIVKCRHIINIKSPASSSTTSTPCI